MVKCIKHALKLNKRFNKNQDLEKGKRFDRSFEENDKGFSKGKEVECFNYGGLRHLSTDCPSLRILKKSMQATWSDTNSGESDSMTSEEVRYE